MKYSEFIKTKERSIKNIGFKPVFMPDILFDFQHDLVVWAVKKGKAAIWAGCGLGKTLMQLTFAQNVYLKTKKPILILAPLGVTAQTKKEGLLIGLDINICSDSNDIISGINITNYEKLHKFDCSVFSGIILDESSILKNFSGAIKTKIVESFYNTKYKLCCSATPSPNDFTEIGTHAEFLNVCSRVEMLATYFIHDSGSTQKWRLKGHAESKFFKWVSNWAVMIEKPSDIGYDDAHMKLPPLNMFEHIVKSEPEHGELFVRYAETLNERRQARKESIGDRCKLAADLNNSTSEQFLNWCNLNDESSLLTELIDNCVEVKGADKNEKKEKNMLAFSENEIEKLTTKPKIAQFGLNWQSCHNMCFVGLSDSFESFYQALRRCYRFGQKHPVNVHIIISEKEGNVLENIKRKEANAKAMLERMVKHISLNSVNQIKTGSRKSKTKTETFIIPKFMRN